MYYDILSLPQKIIWPCLRQFSNENFILYGGTAISLQLNNRKSQNFDFINNEQFDVKKLDKKFKFPRSFVVINKIYTKYSLEYYIKPPIPEKDSHLAEEIHITLSSEPEIHRVYPSIPGNNVNIANLSDLFAIKLVCLLDREEPKDFLDIAALLKHGLKLTEHLYLINKIYYKYSPSIKELYSFFTNILFALSYCDKMNLPKEDVDIILAAIAKANSDLLKMAIK